MRPSKVYQVGLGSIFYAMALGAAAGWWLHETLQPATTGLGIVRVELPIPTGPADRPTAGPPPAAADGAPAPRAATTEPLRKEDPVIGADPIAELRRLHLRMPLDQARLEDMRGGFAQRRDGNRRAHEAVDLLAPRGTPVRAVGDGAIARLFSSRNGGLSVYQFDPGRRFCYYYAHLDGYAESLEEGARVTSGQIIGYVGTTGNAPPDVPHLHFAIFELAPGARWWEGTPLDPYLAFGGRHAD